MGFYYNRIHREWVLDNDSNRILTRSLFEDLFFEHYVFFFFFSSIHCGKVHLIFRLFSCLLLCPKFVQRTLRFSEPFYILHFSLHYTTLRYSTLFYFTFMLAHLHCREEQREKQRARAREREFKLCLIRVALLGK